MRSAYVQCVGGASGDMILGALLDSGVSLDDLNTELAKLKVDGYTLTQQKSQRGGLDGTHLVVELNNGGDRKRNFSDFISIVEASGLEKNDENQVAGERVQYPAVFQHDDRIDHIADDQR